MKVIFIKSQGSGLTGPVLYNLVKGCGLVLFDSFLKGEHAEFKRAVAKADLNHVPHLKGVGRLYVLAVYGNLSSRTGLLGDGAAL